MIDVQWNAADDNADATDMDAHEGTLVVAYESATPARYDRRPVRSSTRSGPGAQGITVGTAGGFCRHGEPYRGVVAEKPEAACRGAGLDRPGRSIAIVGRELLVFEAGTQQIKRFS